MSNSVALVQVQRVVGQVWGRISVNEDLVAHLRTRYCISDEEAGRRVISSAAETALVHTNGDEQAAITALVVVDGRINRIPQCSKLLRKHGSDTVSAAYEIKSELTASDMSLRVLCQLVDNTDRDTQGEVVRLAWALDEIAMQARSKRQRWFLNRIFRERLENGRLIETALDEVLEIAQRPFLAPQTGWDQNGEEDGYE